MSSITYASFINTPPKQKRYPPPPSSDGSQSSTVFVPKTISPTPSLGWDSPQISHRSMPGTPDTDAFSSLPSSRSTTPSPVNMYQRHDKYYIQDDMDDFLVEDIMFRVHRYHLDLESASFPRRPDSRRDPIPLVGVTKLEFESLLDFFYKSMHKEEVPPLSHWSALLSISTRYSMTRIRTRAIHEINTFRPRILPIPQIVLAVAHNVPEWLPLAYAGLTAREEPIQVEEAMSIGLEKTVRISMAREEIRKKKKKNYSVEEVNNAVYRVFWPEEEVPASVTKAVSDLFGIAAEPVSPPPPPPVPQPEEEVDEQGDEQVPTPAAIIEQTQKKRGRGRGGVRTNVKAESVPGSGAVTPVPPKKKTAAEAGVDPSRGANEEVPVLAPVSGANATPDGSEDKGANEKEPILAPVPGANATPDAPKDKGDKGEESPVTKSNPSANPPATNPTDEPLVAKSSVTKSTEDPSEAQSSATKSTEDPLAVKSSTKIAGEPAKSSTKTAEDPLAVKSSFTNPAENSPAAESTEASPATKHTKEETEHTFTPTPPTAEWTPLSPTEPPTPGAADDEGDGEWAFPNRKCSSCNKKPQRCKCSKN